MTVLAFLALGANTRIGQHEHRADAFHVELALEVAYQNHLLTRKVNPVRERLEKIFHIDFTTEKLYGRATLGVSDKPIVRIVLDELPSEEVIDQESALDTVISSVSVDVTLEEIYYGQLNRWIDRAKDGGPVHCIIDSRRQLFRFVFDATKRPHETLPYDVRYPPMLSLWLPWLCPTVCFLEQNIYTGESPMAEKDLLSRRILGTEPETRKMIRFWC